MEGWQRTEEICMTRLTRHTGLNQTLHKMGKHPTGKCTLFSQSETVEHVILQCKKYNNDRNHLLQSLRQAKHHEFSLSGLLGENNRSTENIL